MFTYPTQSAKPAMGFSQESLAVYLEFRRLYTGLPRPGKIRAGHPGWAAEKMPLERGSVLMQNCKGGIFLLRKVMGFLYLSPQPIPVRKPHQDRVVHSEKIPDLFSSWHNRQLKH